MIRRSAFASVFALLFIVWALHPFRIVRPHDGINRLDGLLFIRELPASVASNQRSAIPPGHFTHVGYCYSGFYVVTLSFWMWDGRYCLVAHDGSMRVVQTRAIARDDLAALIAPDPVPAPPLFYRYPPGLLLLAFVALFAVPIAVFRRRALNRAPAMISVT